MAKSAGGAPRWQSDAIGSPMSSTAPLPRCQRQTGSAFVINALYETARSSCCRLAGAARDADDSGRPHGVCAARRGTPSGAIRRRRRSALRVGALRSAGDRAEVTSPRSKRPGSGLPRGRAGVRGLCDAKSAAARQPGPPPGDLRLARISGTRATAAVSPRQTRARPRARRQRQLARARQLLDRVLDRQRDALVAAAPHRQHGQRPAPARVARPAPASCAAMRASTSTAIPQYSDVRAAREVDAPAHASARVYERRRVRSKFSGPV